MLPHAIYLQWGFGHVEYDWTGSTAYKVFYILSDPVNQLYMVVLRVDELLVYGSIFRIAALIGIGVRRGLLLVTGRTGAGARGSGCVLRDALKLSTPPVVRTLRRREQSAVIVFADQRKARYGRTDRRSARFLGDVCASKPNPAAFVQIPVTPRCHRLSVDLI